MDRGEPGRLLHRPQRPLRDRRDLQPRSLYGRWGWRGILAYLIGFAAMTPFFNIGTLYEGPAAKALGGADISFFIGLPAAGLLHYAFTRSVDVAAETRIADAEAADLEKQPHSPQRPEASAGSCADDPDLRGATLLTSPSSQRA